VRGRGSRAALVLLLAGLPLSLGAGGGPLRLVTREGEPVALSLGSDERALVVHFWASWCPDCSRELPALERAAARCQGAPVRVVEVNVGEGPEEVERFRAEHHLALPVLLDPDGRSWRRLAAGLPANLVWTPEGRHSDVGPKDEAAWGRLLEALGCPSEGPR
jgi:thiol-disulfide isomerase/thioredoxin